MIEYTGNRVSRKVIKDFAFVDPNGLLPSAKLKSGTIVTGVDYPAQGMWVDVLVTNPTKTLYFNVPYEYLDIESTVTQPTTNNIEKKTVTAVNSDIQSITIQTLKNTVSEAEKAISQVTSSTDKNSDNKILLILAAVAVFIILISK